MTRTYTVVLMQEPVGGYSVSVPALPGCYSQGDTIAESLAMVRESIELYLESLVDHGKNSPPDKGGFHLDMRGAKAAIVRRVAVTVPEAAEVA
jgi:predicted RNase H-like HicB family nuclease